MKTRIITYRIESSRIISKPISISELDFNSLSSLPARIENRIILSFSTLYEMRETNEVLQDLIGLEKISALRNPRVKRHSSGHVVVPRKRVYKTYEIGTDVSGCWALIFEDEFRENYLMSDVSYIVEFTLNQGQEPTEALEDIRNHLTKPESSGMILFMSEEKLTCHGEVYLW